MFQIKSLLAIAITACCFFVSANAAEPMFNLPKPLENKVFDGMVGTWKADSNAMGVKMHETMKIRWSVNHQFLIVEIKAHSDDKKNNYEGIGVFKKRITLLAMEQILN